MCSLSGRKRPGLSASFAQGGGYGECFIHITTEQGDDLIVSFAIIPEDDFPDDEDDRLEEIAVGKDVVKLVTSHRRYMVDIRHVDDEQKRRMKRILKKMNFDGRFKLKVQ